VDVAVGAGEVPGSFALDYLVSDTKPWLAYFQISNTGTEQTSDWRQRLGFVHHQLTGNDDILRLDYATAGFEDSHAFMASYERPFDGNERVRWQINGGYS